MIFRKSVIAPICAVAALVTWGTSAAEAGWSRYAGGTGPYGRSWYASAHGSCGYHGCSSHQRVTGPRGNTVNRYSSTSCYGGTCSHSATYVGPNGGHVTRSSTVSR